MAKPVLAMEKDAVKATLRRAAGEAMNCALLLGKDKAVALFRMDVRKGPKILLGALQAEFPDGKHPAFGTARLAPDDEALLLLTLNKVPSGATRRIAHALKGSGIKRVRITGEDGSTDSEPEVDEEAETAGTAPAHAPADAALSAPDLAALNERMRVLVGRTKDVLATDPGRKDELVSLAGTAQSRLKAAEAAQDPEAAQAVLGQAGQSLDAWDAALGGAGQQGTQGDGAAGKAPPAPGGERLEQFGTAWTMTHARVRTSLSSLEQALEQAYAQTPVGPQVAAAFRARIAPVLAALDDRLDAKLAAAAKAASPADRAQLAAEARQILEEHAAYVAGESLIADLDGNPFVKVEIGKTVKGTLDKLFAVMG